MEKLYEILQIKQVVSEVREGENHIIRSPIDGAKIVAEFIGDEDREVFLVSKGFSIKSFTLNMRTLSICIKPFI
jgi:hypothetical protein